MAAEILVIDDQVEVLEHLSKILTARGYSVFAASDANSGFATFLERKDSLELVILDLDLADPQADGLSLLSRMKEVFPEVPVLMLSGKGNIRLAINAIRLGAADFLEKGMYLGQNLDISLSRVNRLIKVIEENRRLKKEADALRKKSDFYESLLKSRYSIVGGSEALGRVLEEARTVARVVRPVLIRGERGTGKELIAAYIHFSSDRASGPFVTVNCAAFQGQLLESELFGHEKGAFTGADSRRIGRFERADGGSLFFDEIGNMAPEFQEKILRAIEYGEFERLGGTEKIQVDVRIIAATNSNIEQLKKEGKFREDLYDRLAFKTIFVPPLRERKEDIPLLAGHFLERLLAEAPSTPGRRLSSRSLDKLIRYDWPGNIRELKNVVERAATFARSEEIKPSDIVFEKGGSIPGSGFEEKVEFLQRSLIEEALDSTGGSQKEAARRLRLTYDQFRYYYRKFFGRSGPADR